MNVTQRTFEVDRDAGTVLAYLADFGNAEHVGSRAPGAASGPTTDRSRSAPAGTTCRSSTAARPSSNTGSRRSEPGHLSAGRGEQDGNLDR